MSTYYSYLFPFFFLFLSIPVFSFLELSFLSSILLLLATLLSLFFIRHYLKISPRNFFWSILSFILIFSGLLTLGWLEPYSSPRLFGQEFCLAYLQQGTLYTENPYCVQGPITYVVAYLIRFVFSDERTVRYETLSHGEWGSPYRYRPRRKERLFSSCALRGAQNLQHIFPPLRAPKNRSAVKEKKLIVN